MTTHEINLLIERYLDGETTPAEERELALAVQRENRPAEWAIIAEMLGDFTTDEALWATLSPRAGRTDSLSQEVVTTSPRSGGLRGVARWSWAAAACAIVVVGLFYNIIKKEPQDMAKAELPLPVRPQQKILPATQPQPLKPSSSKSLKLKTFKAQNLQMELPSVEEPLLDTPAEQQFSEGQVEQTLLEPQLIAEVKVTPPEDLSLCMVLLAEVEARAVMLQQASPPQAPQTGGIYTTATDALLQEIVTTSPRSGEARGDDGEWNFLLNELLVNIQQQSNRPELSL